MVLAHNKKINGLGIKDLGITGLILLVLLLFSTILFTGCEVTEGGGFGGIPFFNPYSGSKGLQINFLENAPDIVFSGMPYKIGFDLINLGALDIKNGILVIGYDDFGGASVDKTKIVFDLKGKKETRNFIGERKIELIDAKAPELEGKKQTTMLLSYLACYPYQTKAQISLCVDTNPFSMSKKGCRVEPIELDSQGAPVAVVRVDESTIPVGNGKVQLLFKILVENKGSGIVVLKDAYSKLCSNEELKPEEVNALQAHAKLGFQDLECSPERIVLSASDEGTLGFFTCRTKEMPMKDAYKSVLTIFLDYGYIQSGMREVMIYNLK